MKVLTDTPYLMIRNLNFSKMKILFFFLGFYLVLCVQKIQGSNHLVGKTSIFLGAKSWHYAFWLHVFWDSRCNFFRFSQNLNTLGVFLFIGFFSSWPYWHRRVRNRCNFCRGGVSEYFLGEWSERIPRKLKLGQLNHKLRLFLIIQKE